MEKYPKRRGVSSRKGEKDKWVAGPLLEEEKAASDTSPPFQAFFSSLCFGRGDNTWTIIHPGTLTHTPQNDKLFFFYKTNLVFTLYSLGGLIFIVCRYANFWLTLYKSEISFRHLFKNLSKSQKKKTSFFLEIDWWICFLSVQKNSDICHRWWTRFRPVKKLETA